MKAFSKIGLVLWDKSARAFVLALRSLWLHKLRAFLSVLGIIIGTAAVIVLIGFGEGSMRDALDDIARQGATNIIIRSVKPPEDANSQKRSFVAAYGLNERDYEAFKLIGATEAEPWVVAHVPMRVFPYEVRNLQRMRVGRVVATTDEYTKVNQIEMNLGRFLLDSDDYDAPGDDVSMRNICVLGSEIAEGLFPFENPIGKSVVINRHHYVVVGVVAERIPTGGSGGSQAAEEFNNDVYIPFRTSFGRFGTVVFLRSSGSRSGEQVKYSQITLKIDKMEHVEAAGGAVKDWLEATHYRPEFAVTIPLDRLREAERMRNRFLVLLAIIGGISLVVGGIGIMNIMLSTVTERTREIGIRRALGAKRRDITLQFLIEAVVQTSVGGILGVLLGVFLVFTLPLLAALVGEHSPARLHVPWTVAAFAVSTAVGVLFGWYPARRASRMDPIEALRHE